MTGRTAVYEPVSTVVWEGSGRKARPYPDWVQPTTGTVLQIQRLTPITSFGGRDRPDSASMSMQNSMRQFNRLAIGVAGVTLKLCSANRVHLATLPAQSVIALGGRSAPGSQ